MNVVVVGTGYVGLTTGVGLAYIGHQVMGVDKDPQKLEKLRRFESPIHEPGLEELLRLVPDRLRFTDNLDAVADADLILIAVGTPPKSNGNANTRYVETAAREVAKAMRPGGTYTVVVKSTVPIGSNRRVAHVIDRTVRERGIKATVHVASNPEFLREGTALYDMLYPDRIVVGADAPEAVETLRRLYRPILEQSFPIPEFLPRPESRPLPPFITTDPISAELIKYAANAFLALKISFINEIAGLCEKVGADVRDVARGIGTDSRIGPRFLAAGLGWGGSCFPKDTAALSAVGQEYGYDMPIVEAARMVNQRQRQRLVDKLQELLKGVRGRTVGILGLAFKPGTDDVRESPALELVRLLLERDAHVRVHDPVALANAQNALAAMVGVEDVSEVEFCHDPYEMAVGADALVLATEWPDYRELEFDKLARAMRNPVLVDGRNFLPEEAVRAAGFVYQGVGR
ncbi:MAG: UDP-glucose/GDP-mannose dehydrogenase family protein [Firmicutes bacterium]|nr:UDP-glucose/GDP-mannose dehydrogenase family protein [Bacillota bacterium]